MMEKPKRFDIKTHEVTIYEEHIIIKPKSNNHLLIIGAPDSDCEPNKYFETSIYIGNHGCLLVKGKHKGTMQFCLQHGEYPTELGFDESEGKFTRNPVYDMIEQEH